MAVFAMEETNPERGVRLSVHTRAHTLVCFHSHIDPLDPLKSENQISA